MTHPAYDTVRPVTPHASVLLQHNPGPMTLDGTNTWLLRAPDSDDVVVVDPGQRGDNHLDLLIEAAPKIAVVLITHGHFDHSQTAADLHDRTGAVVRAVDPQFCFGGNARVNRGALSEGTAFEAAGLRVKVLATPGHSSDSASFVLSTAGGEAAAVLTGDTILGRGTTVVDHPDGVLGAYLNSLRRLRELGELTVLPGHGPELPQIGPAAEYYLAHREERLGQVRDALVTLGPDASARAIVELVYADVDQVLWPAAERSVLAQLAYLRA